MLIIAKAVLYGLIRGFGFGTWLCNSFVFILLASTVFAQQPDASKLAPIYQQQRNAEADARAQCYAVAVQMQTRINDLEKQVADLKAEKKD